MLAIEFLEKKKKFSFSQSSITHFPVSLKKMILLYFFFKMYILRNIEKKRFGAKKRLFISSCQQLVP